MKIKTTFLRLGITLLIMAASSSINFQCEARYLEELMAFREDC